MWDWQYSTKPSHTHIGGNVLWNIVSLTQHCYRFWIMLCKVITQNQCWSGIVFFDTIWFHFFLITMRVGSLILFLMLLIHTHVAHSHVHWSNIGLYCVTTLGVHSLLELGTMCLHNHEIRTLDIQDFSGPSWSWYTYISIARKPPQIHTQVIN